MMSLCTLKTTMARIKSAVPSSAIAVFRCNDAEKLDVVFAATVLTQDKIKAGDPNLIGVYDGTMDQDAIKRELDATLGSIK